MLDKQNFPYEKLNAEENVELAKQFGVKQAPTLVVTTEGGFEKYAGRRSHKTIRCGLCPLTIRAFAAQQTQVTCPVTSRPASTAAGRPGQSSPLDR